MLFRCACVVFLLVGFMRSNARGEDYSAISKPDTDAANRTWETEIEPKFLQALSPSDRRKVESIDFRFVPGGGASDAFANRTPDGAPFVLISGAFLQFQDVAIDGLIVSQTFGLSSQYRGYIKDALQVAKDNYTPLKLGEPMHPIPLFAAYAGIPEADVMRLIHSQQYVAELNGFRTLSLAFVLGHEIGHHVDGDIDHPIDQAQHPEQQQKRENNADLFSTRLLLKAGFSPLGAIPVMLFFQEGGPDITHPPAECRWLNFALQGVPALEADPGFQQYMDQNPGMRKNLSDFKSEVRRDRPQIEASCGPWLFSTP